MKINTHTILINEGNPAADKSFFQLFNFRMILWRFICKNLIYTVPSSFYHEIF